MPHSRPWPKQHPRRRAGRRPGEHASAARRQRAAGRAAADRPIRSRRRATPGSRRSWSRSPRPSCRRSAERCCRSRRSPATRCAGCSRRWSSRRKHPPGEAVLLLALRHAVRDGPAARVARRRCPERRWREVEGRAQPLLGRCPPAQRDVLRRRLADAAVAARGDGARAAELDERELGASADPERLCFNVNEPASCCRRALAGSGAGGRARSSPGMRSARRAAA